MTISLTDHRAWLQTADTAKMRPQTQLRLLIDNMSLPVSSKAIVLESVLEAWKKALQALECLIKGEALQINDGAILLGLSAWHIYPDIVLAGTNEYIKQGDELVHPGGIVTLGLINRRGDDGGMFWSLPLAHARYYGGVEITKRHAGVRESQVSFEEFMFVVLGSILSGWDANDLDLSAQLGLIQDIGKAVRDDIPDARPQSVREMDSVLTYLSSLVSQYTKAKDVYKQQITRLISFGRRRCSEFLAPRPFQPLPAFGLVNFTTLMGTFSEDNEDSVKFLRSWAKREMPSDFTSCAVIRYRTGNYTLFKYTNVDDQEPHPKKKPRTNAVGNTSSATETSHLHWIEDIDVKKRQEDRTGEVLLPPGPGEKPRRYIFFCGDSDLAAIYFPADRKVPEIPRKNCMSVPQLISCIQHENLTLPQIAIALRRMASSLTYEAYIDSLRAIGRAESIYSKLPGAKVDLQVTSTRISEAKWWKEIKSQQACTLPAIFSCIAYFEIGIFDANPETIGEHTFALCHGTSIFVANSLLTDPIDEASIIPVKRIVGNIGKPGLAFLTSPSTPEIRKVDYSSWHAVSHLPFDGAAQNNFPATSFHLSFTGYEYAMDLNRQSGRDAPAHLVETAIAVYDKGNWVADLDIIKASRSWVKVARWDCQHSDEEKADVSSLGPTVSVDCWEELLDPPVENAVVRSHENWAARLATAALAVQIGLHVMILPPTQCWMCLYTEIASQGIVLEPSEIDEDEEMNRSDSEDGGESYGSETNYDLDGNLDDGEIDIYSFRLPTPEAASEERTSEAASEEQAKPRAILIY